MVYLTGDTHGTDGVLQRILGFHNGYIGTLEGDKTLIVAGDFGLLWKKDSNADIRYIQKYITKNIPTFILAFVAGNHENFDLIEKLPQVEKWGGTVGQVSENIFHLNTGQVYTIENETYAIYGGAVSIDKYHRKEGSSWWPQEVTTKEQLDTLVENLEKHNFSVDYFLTHTCADDEIYLVEKYPFTDKVTDPVAADIRNLKRILDIRVAHIFGHFHYNKPIFQTPYQCWCLHEVLLPVSFFKEGLGKTY